MTEMRKKSQEKESSQEEAKLKSKEFQENHRTGIPAARRSFVSGARRKFAHPADRPDLIGLQVGDGRLNFFN